METKTHSTNENRICQNCKSNFVIEPDDFLFYEKIKVPPPTFCPECRNIQRMAIRNVKSLYKRKCDLCKKEVVSRFSINNKAVMYCQDCWWSDEWDPLDYGKDYDFSKSFFEQFRELLFSVPQASLLNVNMVNSDYCNMESEDKGCYLTFGGHYNEDCAFSEYSINGKEIYDSYWAFKSEQCFNCVMIENCYKVFYSRECYDSMDTYFSYDCINCNNIIGCAGLRNKSYCIFNEQYTKEEYQKIKNDFDFGSNKNVAELIKKSNNVWNSSPHKCKTSVNSFNSDGNYLVNTNNSHNAWQLADSENSKHIYIGGWIKESYDETSMGQDELCYMCSSGGGLYGSIAVAYSFANDVMGKKHSLNCSYSYTLMGCNDCFGCVGLQKKKYCILNKQYEKEEYFKLKEKIIKHMTDMPYIAGNGYIYKYGDFFPNGFGLFAYNETVANDFYSREIKDILSEGFDWRDEQETQFSFSDYEIPDNIKDVDDSILDKVLKCEQTGKPYKIIKQELDFYRKIGCPIPRISPFVRIRNRIKSLLPFKLFDRKCYSCNKNIKTAYSSDRKEVIFCEDCYNKAIY